MSLTQGSLLAVCAVSGVGWALLAAIRGAGGSWRGAVRPLLGGGAAFGVALGAYQLLVLSGVEVSWERVLAGGGDALLLAAMIGLVEEGAKLAGIALAAQRPAEPGAMMRTTVGVAASFAALESALALAGVSAPVALARALLAPVAHAVLAAPLGFAVAWAARSPRGAALKLAAGLAVAAALHAVADLSLAAPRFGRLGYAAALLAPVVVIFLHARRLVLQPALRGRG